jgi:nicotinate-nucleotide--dimethylbenzimidazole phosphoribosyltransferase
MSSIHERAARVRKVDEESMALARKLQDSLTKPRGSLGKLETLSIRLAGIYRTPHPCLKRKVVFTMAADHGVTEEGVSAYPSDVTAQMVLNFARGGAAINVLARHAGAEVRVVDMGVRSDIQWPDPVLSRKVMRGSRNMAQGPAMTKEQALEALDTGAQLASEAAESGANAVAIGDMGIGNTTAASAITAVVTGRKVEEVTGRGTGIDDRSLSLKIRAIEKAIKVNSPDPNNGVDLVSKVGGLEIAGLAGVAIGAASSGVPVFLDGFVSSSAALVAAAICPEARDYMIASHLSVEPGHRFALEHLGLDPLLDLGMRLGEGTGAALAFMIAEASCKILNEMATFENAGVSRSDNKEAIE